MDGWTDGWMIPLPLSIPPFSPCPPRAPQARLLVSFRCLFSASGFFRLPPRIFAHRTPHTTSDLPAPRTPHHPTPSIARVSHACSRRRHCCHEPDDDIALPPYDLPNFHRTRATKPPYAPLPPASQLASARPARALISASSASASLVLSLVLSLYASRPRPQVLFPSSCSSPCSSPCSSSLSSSPASYSLRLASSHTSIRFHVVSFSE